MKITCPKCHFSREVAQDMLPKNTRTATCPLCQHSFSFARDEVILEQDRVDSSTGTMRDDVCDFNKKDAKSQVGIRDRATSAYQGQTEQFEREDSAGDNEANSASEDFSNHAHTGFAIQNPWEQQKEIGFFAAFFQTILRICFAPARFFAGLSVHTPLNFAFVFYVIISVLQISIERFWGQVMINVLTPMAANDPQLQQMLSMFTPKSSYLHILMVSTTFSLVELFIAAGFYYFMFRLIAPASSDFKLIFQITAYATAPVLLCVVPGIGSIVGFAWSLAVTAFGCRYALGLTWVQALLGILPFYLIVIPLLLRFAFTFAL